MNISAAPWSGSLLLPPSDFRPARTCLILVLALCLGACASSPRPDLVADAAYQQQVLQMEYWYLRGRLNIRSNNYSDTININWLQDTGAFEINLSGALGLGAVRITGDTGGVMIEKAGKEPFTAPSLEAIGTNILGYAFPASELLYWIRGLPAPGRIADVNYNESGLVATISQPDATGKRWELQFDRFDNIAGHILPRRISLEQSSYRLTLLVSDWELDAGDAG